MTPYEAITLKGAFKKELILYIYVHTQLFNHLAGCREPQLILLLFNLKHCDVTHRTIHLYTYGALLTAKETHRKENKNWLLTILNEILQL